MSALSPHWDTQPPRPGDIGPGPEEQPPHLMRHEPLLPKDHTISQRTAAKRLFLWLAVVIAAFICAALAGSARAEDAGASAPSGAGQRVSTESVSPMFITDFLTMLKLFGSAAVGAGVLFGVQHIAKRKPSVDEELAVHAERTRNAPQSSEVAGMKEQIKTLENSVKRLFAERDEIKEELSSISSSVARLEANQGHNTTAISDIRREIKGDIQAQDLMHDRKHSTMSERIDKMMAALADIAARIPKK